MSITSSWLICYWVKRCSCWFSAHWVYFWQRGVEVCNYNSRFVCFSSGSYIWFCLVNFYTLLLGRYTLKIIRSSWRIDPTVIMECSSLYLLTPFALRPVCLTLNPLLWLSLISINVVSLSPSICFYTTCVFVCGFVHAYVLSHVDSVISQTLWSHGSHVVRQASLSMGFSRQEHQNGLLFPSPRDHPDPGTEPVSPVSFIVWSLIFKVIIGVVG